MSLLRPVLGNGEPLIELLGIALSFERVLQRHIPSHLRTTDRPRIRESTCQQLPWRLAHGHACDVASPTEKLIVKVAADVKEAQAVENSHNYHQVH